MQHLSTLLGKAKVLHLSDPYHVNVKARLGSSRWFELSNILHRLCEPPSIPLSFSLATVLPRRSTYHFRSGCDPVERTTAKCSSFRARTTGVSNPVRSPSFRASASVAGQQVAFATGVPPDIYAFHRYTWSSTCPYRTLAVQYRMQFLG